MCLGVTSPRERPSPLMLALAHQKVLGYIVTCS
ncbi:unnamed protein product [Acanthoscelides obtectus]|uniref:Uncharacterized protein n=1 Tax=Acanthoscelides obtectus TaxID=200917 RepID=A0A9P0P6E8_ACAOB|nr:unnamed protein product [Acanthoscelides obtectus]CAK1667487.1 hypothetical protein AOBTE_LOCUS25866 [Acanthoscelides obtectus]